MIVYARRGDRMLPVLVDDDWSHEGKLSIASHGYVQMTEAGAGRSVLMHRWLLGLTPGDGLIGDHRNRNELDNRRINLRAVTPSESNLNRGPSDNPLRGVYEVPSGRYTARVKWHRRMHNLGTFDTSEEAAAVVRAFSIEIHPTAA